MPSLSENIKVVRASLDRVVPDHFEIYVGTSSIMSNFNANLTSQSLMNDTCFRHSLEGGRSKNVNKMVKTIQQKKHKRGCYIRNSSWTSTNVTSLIDDGYTWRKYGQKEIIKAKHKRNYYRCANKFEQGCQATKQVQKIEDEPTKYKITYNRHHTCKNFLSTPQIILDTTTHKDTSILLSFESNGIIEKEQAGLRFLSPKHEEPNDGFSSLELKPTKSSSHNYTLPYDSIMLDPLGPVPEISSSFEHEDVIPKGVYSSFYELDNMLETIRLSEIPFDFSYPELTGLNYF